MSLLSNKLLRAALSTTALGLLASALASTAQAALQIELTAVVTDNSSPNGTVVATETEGPATASGSFPTYVTLTTPNGASFGGITLTNGGATHTASDPGTTVNTSVGSLLDSVVDQLTNQATGVRNAEVVISATGYTQPIPGSLSLNLDGRWSNAANSSITATWYLNPTNQLATVTGTVGSNNRTLNLNGGQQVGTSYTNTAANNTLLSFSNSQLVSSPSQNTPYGMTLVFDLVLTPNAQLQDRGQAMQAYAVPEPATIATAISGLPVLGLIWARRRRRSKA